MIFNLLTTLYFQSLMKYIPVFNQKQVKINIIAPKIKYYTWHCYNTKLIVTYNKSYFIFNNKNW